MIIIKLGGSVITDKTTHIAFLVIPGLTRNPLCFQIFKLLDAPASRCGTGSSKPAPDHNPGSGMTDTHETLFEL